MSARDLIYYVHISAHCLAAVNSSSERSREIFIIAVNATHRNLEGDDKTVEAIVCLDNPKATRLFARQRVDLKFLLGAMRPSAFIVNRLFALMASPLRFSVFVQFSKTIADGARASRRRWRRPLAAEVADTSGNRGNGSRFAYLFTHSSSRSLEK